jgi:hypothetical protein
MSGTTIWFWWYLTILAAPLLLLGLLAKDPIVSRWGRSDSAQRLKQPKEWPGRCASRTGS